MDTLILILALFTGVLAIKQGIKWLLKALDEPNTGRDAINRVSTDYQPSELHSRDRYAATAKLERQLKNNIPTCKKNGCNEPVYEFGQCFKHYCISKHQ